MIPTMSGNNDRLCQYKEPVTSSICGGAHITRKWSIFKSCTYKKSKEKKINLTINHFITLEHVYTCTCTCTTCL